MVPKPRISYHLRMVEVVGERSVVLRRQTEKTAGGTGSDYAGIVAKKHARNVFAVSLRFPGEG